MKKLMILAVAMVAMAMGGKAEAALRFVVTDGSTTHVYYSSSNTSDTIFFSLTGFSSDTAGMKGTANVLASNWPGTSDLASLTQTVTLFGPNQITTAKNLTFTLDVIDDVMSAVSGSDATGGEVNFGAIRQDILDAPLRSWDVPQGPSIVTSAISANSSSYVAANAGAKAQATTFLNPVFPNPTPTNVTIAVNARSGSDDTSFDVYNPTFSDISGQYTLRNVLTLTNFTTNASNFQNVQYTSSSNITSVVPEPTSLALAGFAGIGMAVGAIRRRRQAKQAA